MGDKVDKNLLRQRMGEELMMVINQQGLNINQMVGHKHMERALHFICGLGPRKATSLIKIIKQLTTGKLENRIDMVRNCQMTQQVFLNCAGFLQIAVRDLPDSND